MIETTPPTDEWATQLVLKERARALAAPPESETSLDTLALVVVSVGSERYGIDVGHVQEIRPLAGLVQVPGTPATWSGLVNLRGSLYPVLDLRANLGIEAGPANGRDHVVVVSDGRNAVALLVDDAYEVTEVSRDRLDTSMTVRGKGGTEVGRGVTLDLLSVLDVEALLADPSLVVRDEAR